MDIQERIIPVYVGRGKSGQAQNGRPRFMFVDSEGQDRLSRFLRPYWTERTVYGIVIQSLSRVVEL